MGAELATAVPMAVRPSAVLLLSEDPVIAELVTSSVDAGFTVVSGSQLANERGSPAIILVDILDGLPCVENIERLRDRFPGTPIVTFGPEHAPCATEDHISRAQLDSDRIRRVIRTVVDRRDALDDLRWRTALLAGSEERFSALVSNSSDVIGLLERDGTCRYASSSADRILGYEPEVMTGKNFVAIAHDDDAAGVESFLAAIRASPGQPLTHSFRAVKSDGGWIDAEVVAVNQLDNALVEGIVINLRDVTSRRERERKLRENETELRLLVQQLPAMVWTTDRELRITSMRGHGLTLLGSHVNQTKGATISELFGANDPNGVVVRAHHEALEGHSAQTQTFSWHDRLLNAYVEPLRKEDGTITGTIGLSVDVTELSLTHERLRRSEEQYREAQRVAHIGSWEWDFAGNHVDVSDELLNIFGMEAADFTGTFEAFLALFGTEDRAISAAIDDARLLQEGFEKDLTVRLPDRRIRSFHVRGSVVLNAGLVSRMIGTVQDVTERTVLRQEVARAQRLDSLGRMAANIAHEFNNTLMGISPAAELLARRATDPAASDAATRILQSVQRGKRITSEILRFAQPSEPDVESVDVAAWMETVANELRQVVGPAIEFQVILPPDPLFIAGDIQQLTQVLINLGLNARDAMPSGGHVFLSATATRPGHDDGFGLPQSDQYVHLQIRDTGSGIDPETAAQIFEPLFTTRRSGTGLGLAVVQQITAQHKGHVFVTSEPGHGTTFHLFLPATVESRPVELIHPGNGVTLSHKRILLVEDDVNVAAGIAEILRLEGLEVEVIGEGMAVMGAIRRFRPDAVVLDVGLPDLSGAEILLQIEKNCPDLPVVLSSGHADPGLIAKVNHQHRFGFLHKPYGVSTLLATLGDVMA